MVFKAREDVREMDTAVSLLVDLSGSMGDGGKIQMAAQATVALAEALEGTGVTYNVVGFHNDFMNTGVSSMGREERQAVAEFNRLTAIEMREFKRFGEGLGRPRPSSLRYP